jgi:hypothetical protein
VIVLFVCWYAIAANYDYDALAVALASDANSATAL